MIQVYSSTNLVTIDINSEGNIEISDGKCTIVIDGNEDDKIARYLHKNKCDC